MTMQGFRREPPLPRAEATPERVAQLLPNEYTFSAAAAQPVEWGRFLETHHPGIGEVNETSDWSKFPTSENIRVVALVIDDQYVIRWASTKAMADVGMSRAPHRPSHDDLVREGDPMTGRGGYVRMLTSGDLQIS
jgi:hypothetical protein